MKLQVLVDMGVPEQLRKPAPEVCPKPPIEDRVRQMIENIESDRDSYVDFRALNHLYDDLCRMKQNKRIENLRNMIKPVLSKFGYHKE